MCGIFIGLMGMKRGDMQQGFPGTLELWSFGYVVMSGHRLPRYLKITRTQFYSLVYAYVCVFLLEWRLFKRELWQNLSDTLIYQAFFETFSFLFSYIFM